MSSFEVNVPEGGSDEKPDESPMSEGTVEKALLPDMLNRLETLTGADFRAYEQPYGRFVVNAHIAAGNTVFFDRLTALRDQLADEREVGKIRGVEAWADGTDSFKHVWKSWDSFVDKIYRLNIEENDRPDQTPRVLTIQEMVERANEASNRNWVTPENAHNFIDDLIRTKLVVPFADGVMQASATIKAAAAELGLRHYRRYHAKDSGYHAHHVYVLVPVPGLDGSEVEIAFEVKVLTKLQDTLSELTHLLYEYKRTGRMQAQKKRKLAWEFESPDFTASYIGHSAHYIEASLVRLKTELAQLERNQ